VTVAELNANEKHKACNLVMLNQLMGHCYHQLRVA